MYNIHKQNNVLQKKIKGEQKNESLVYIKLAMYSIRCCTASGVLEGASVFFCWEIIKILEGDCLKNRRKKCYIDFSLNRYSRKRCFNE